MVDRMTTTAKTWQWRTSVTALGASLALAAVLGPPMVALRPASAEGLTAASGVASTLVLRELPGVSKTD
jgi:hypothetical protein